MQKPGIPASEAQRIETLRELLILDTEPEARFDAVTAYAASVFQVDIALVSLVDTDRQWFKSHHGIDVCETSRDVSFCGHAILSDDLFEVRDALADARFADNPLVTGEPKIRFYAGAPLVVSNGERIGTLCLIHPRPKHLDEWQRAHLRTLARMVSAELQGIPAETVQGYIDIKKAKLEAQRR